MSGTEWQTIEALRNIASGLHSIASAIAVIGGVFAWYVWRST